MKAALILSALLPFAFGAAVLERDLPEVNIATLAKGSYTSAAADQPGVSPKVPDSLTGRAAAALVCPPKFPRYCKKANLCCRGLYCCAKECCKNDVDFCYQGRCYKNN